MKEIKFNLKKEEYSTMLFATSLNKAVSKLSSEVIVKTVSENNISQTVDAKTMLGVIAIMHGTADELIFEVRGPEEALDAMELKAAITKILELSAK